MVDDRYQFIYTDEFATGEGRTISLMITRAYPHRDDYDESIPSGIIDGKFVMPTLKEGVTPKIIAAREFAGVFGGWTLKIAEFLSREEFLSRCGRFLPEHVVRFLEAKEKDDAGNFKYYSRYHVNYS